MTTIADYIVTRLAKHVTHAYGVYGAASAHLFDSFNRLGKPVMVPTAGEQGAAFAAEGHAKATNSIGVCVTTSGPGALNAATGVANCYYDSVPVLFLCGQVSTKVKRHGTPLRQRGFQECPTADVMRPIAKCSHEVERPDEVRDALEYALEAMTTGRPGPAVLSLPLDVLSALVPKTWPAKTAYSQLLIEDPDNGVVPNDVAACLAALAKAERPIILAGGGVRDCAPALRRFAETVGVQVVRTWNALDLIPDDWPLYAGNVGTYGGKGRNFVVQQADFALVIGCRLSGRITGGRTESFLRGARAGHGIWHVDCDRGVMRGIEDDVPERKRLLCYANQFLKAAQEAARNGGGGNPRRTDLLEWRHKVRTWCETYDPGTLGSALEARSTSGVPGGVNPYLFIRELSELAPDNAIVVSECGGNAVVFHQAWESKLGQRIFSSHGGSAMGQGLGLAIGAAIAQPDRPVIAVIGDGGFALAAAELNTMRVQRERLKNLRVFVVNNRSYGITAAWQVENLEGRRFACGPDAASGYEAPDIPAVCRGYGVTPQSYTPSLDLAALLRDTGSLVVDVPCPGWETYEPRVVGWDRPVEEAIPSLPEAEFLANMRDVPPLPGWKERRRK